MKILSFILLLFVTFSSHAEVFKLDDRTFIDIDALIKQIPAHILDTESNRSLAKPFTGKVQSPDSKFVWDVVDGIKNAEYPIIHSLGTHRALPLYQKPDETVYTVKEDKPFTGTFILSIRATDDNTTIITQRKYQNGIPNEIEHQEAPAFKNPHHHYPPGVRKPIIYLYPREETEVTVKAGQPEKFTHTYPKYVDGWRVLATSNGDLSDLKTGRHLYALYWEGRNTSSQAINEGFVVKGADTISFLEEKLALLGLNEREAEEFIIYWLPKLENNPYNLIHFESIAQQNENMPLDITPKPDTLIRVLMEYKPLEDKIDLPEQILPPTPTRTGFTVVEWGGTELKEKD